MVLDELEAFAIEVQSAFLSQDMSVLRRKVSLPLVVYSIAGVAVLRNEARLRTMIRTYMQMVEDSRIARGTTKVIYSSPEQNGRLKIGVQNALVDPEGRSIVNSEIRYFLVRRDHGLVIEMLEYLAAPFELADIEKIYH